MYNKIILANGTNEEIVDIPKLKSSERLKDIEGYEGEYAVTSHGRVWSYKNSHGSISSQGGWLKGTTRGGKRKQGYVRVHLGRKFYSIHRLVATAFIKKVKNKNIVNHIDGNPKNNTVNNLEWCTHSENFIHASKKGLRQNIHQSKLSIDDMSELCEAFSTGMFSLREIGRYFGVSHSTIGGIVNNKTHNKRTA